MKNETSKHTPGPWFMHEDYDEIYVDTSSNLNGPSTIVAHITLHNGEPCSGKLDTDRANAQLIASAPETAAERDRLKEELENVKEDHSAMHQLYEDVAKQRDGLKEENEKLKEQRDHWRKEFTEMQGVAMAAVESESTLRIINTQHSSLNKELVEALEKCYKHIKAFDENGNPNSAWEDYDKAKSILQKAKDL